jgi:hypothetical protein
MLIDIRDEDYGGQGFTCRDPEGMCGVSAPTIPGIERRGAECERWHSPTVQWFRPGPGDLAHGRGRHGAALEVAALREGIERGLTLIDTAEMYGEGGAEAVVGEAIRGQRDGLFLVSKVYRTTPAARAFRRPASAA